MTTGLPKLMRGRNKSRRPRSSGTKENVKIAMHSRSDPFGLYAPTRLSISPCPSTERLWLKISWKVLPLDVIPSSIFAEIVTMHCMMRTRASQTLGSRTSSSVGGMKDRDRSSSSEIIKDLLGFDCLRDSSASDTSGDSSNQALPVIS